MTGAEWLMLAAGLAFVSALGAWHLAGLLIIMKLKPSSGDHPYFAVLFSFWGLLALHFSEIVLSAVAFWVALSLPGAGAITGGYGESTGGLLYFAGISFATLGFTGQTLHGPIRLLGMSVAVGGFMLITWSATFVYSIWSHRFRENPGRR